VRHGLRAGAVAAALSGAPSTAHALATARDPLEATLAAGSLLLPRETRRGRLLAAAVPVHLVLSLGWAVVFERAGVRGARAGAAAGLGVAALDLGLVGRRFRRVRELPLLPQVADHVAFGAVVGALLVRYEAAASPGRGSSTPDSGGPTGTGASGRR
jgi:hypothetical protein